VNCEVEPSQPSLGNSDTEYSTYSLTRSLKVKRIMKLAVFVVSLLTNLPSRKKSGRSSYWGLLEEQPAPKPCTLVGLLNTSVTPDLWTQQIDWHTYCLLCQELDVFVLPMKTYDGSRNVKVTNIFACIWRILICTRTSPVDVAMWQHTVYSL